MYIYGIDTFVDIKISSDILKSLNFLLKKKKVSNFLVLSYGYHTDKRNLELFALLFSCRKSRLGSCMEYESCGEHLLPEHSRFIYRGYLDSVDPAQNSKRDMRKHRKASLATCALASCSRFSRYREPIPA